MRMSIKVRVRVSVTEVFCGSFHEGGSGLKFSARLEGASGNRQRVTPSNDDSFDSPALLVLLWCNNYRHIFHRSSQPGCSR